MQQLAVKTGEATISSKIDAGSYSNLGQVISDEVKLHEANGFKFGGVSFTTISGSKETHYSLSGDVLHEQVYSYDSSTNRPGRVISENTIHMNPGNKSKFSTLSPGLMRLLTRILVRSDGQPSQNLLLPHSHANKS